MGSRGSSHGSTGQFIEMRVSHSSSRGRINAAPAFLSSTTTSVYAGETRRTLLREAFVIQAQTYKASHTLPCGVDVHADCFCLNGAEGDALMLPKYFITYSRSQ